MKNKVKERKKKSMKNSWASGNLKVHTQRHTSFYKVVPPNPNQEVPSSNDQASKHMSSLGAIFIQTTTVPKLVLQSMLYIR